MRRFLGLLLLLWIPVGCGEDPQDPGLQPADPEPGLVQMLVLTSAGGEVSPTAYFVDDGQQMKAYAKTFEDRDQVIESLQQAAEDAGDHEGRLAAATVFIGCDTPSDVHVTEGEDGWEVHPKKVPDSKLQCFAPMTSIALVEIP